MKPNKNNALSYKALASLWRKEDKMRSIVNLDESSNSEGDVCVCVCVCVVVRVSAEAETRFYKAI